MAENVRLVWSPFAHLLVSCNSSLLSSIVFPHASLLHRKPEMPFRMWIEPIHRNGTACHVCDRSLLSVHVHCVRAMPSHSISRNMQPSAPNNRVITIVCPASVLFSKCSANNAGIRCMNHLHTVSISNVLHHRRETVACLLPGGHTIRRTIVDLKKSKNKNQKITERGNIWCCAPSESRYLLTCACWKGEMNRKHSKSSRKHVSAVLD